MSKLPLSGKWSGTYWYETVPGLPTNFAAQLIQFGSSLSGSINEVSEGLPMEAIVDGFVDNLKVGFAKHYKGSRDGYDTVFYTGYYDPDADEISGDWNIDDLWFGKFLMLRQSSKEFAQKSVSINASDTPYPKAEFQSARLSAPIAIAGPFLHR